MSTSKQIFVSHANDTIFDMLFLNDFTENTIEILKKKIKAVCDINHNNFDIIGSTKKNETESIQYKISRDQHVAQLADKDEIKIIHRQQQQQQLHQQQQQLHQQQQQQQQLYQHEQQLALPNLNQTYTELSNYCDLNFLSQQQQQQSLYQQQLHQFALRNLNQKIILNDSETINPRKKSENKS